MLHISTIFLAIIAAIFIVIYFIKPELLIFPYSKSSVSLYTTSYLLTKKNILKNLIYWNLAGDYLKKESR